MKHVFVESNWVYDFCSPQHRRKPEAERLRERAERGNLRLYVPGICLREGAESVRRKCQPRLGDLGDYRRSAEQRGGLSENDGAVVTRFFEQYHLDVRRDLDQIGARLDSLRRTTGVEAFALSDAMLERVLQLRTAVVEVSQMKHFDEAILGAVIVRGEALHGNGDELIFCTLDSDLLPWDKDGRPRVALANLYKGAGFVDGSGSVAVRNDFRVP
jgi:hypothetical protein